ncbi:MAG: hypothetical protein PVF47_07350, partial [Anaerolineae bacterium]
MNLSGLLPFIQGVPAYQQLVGAVERGELASLLGDDPARGLGVILPARPYLIAALYRQLHRPLVVLTTRA